MQNKCHKQLLRNELVGTDYGEGNQPPTVVENSIIFPSLTNAELRAYGFTNQANMKAVKEYLNDKKITEQMFKEISNYLKTGKIEEKVNKALARKKYLWPEELEINISYEKDYVKDFPSNFGKLTMITNLTLRSVGLKTIPEPIGKLINIKNLDLYGNELKSVPGFIRNLKELKFFDLGENDLVEFPEVTTQLLKLINLGLGYNKISSVPESICKLTKLKELSLIDNSFTEDTSPPLSETDKHNCIAIVRQKYKCVQDDDDE